MRAFRRLTRLAWAAASMLALAGPARAACALKVVADLPVTIENGQVIASALLNDRPARLVVSKDTWFGYLTRDAATRVGAHVDGNSAIYIGSMKLGGAAFGASDFFLTKNDLFGAADGYLGYNVVAAADTEYDLANGEVRLMRASGCDGTSLAYWTTSKTYGVLTMPPGFLGRDVVDVGLNGVNLHLLVSPTTVQSLIFAGAAKRAGVDVESAADAVTHPLVIQGWPTSATIVSVAKMDFGGETVQHTRIAVAPGLARADVDGVLGLDFLLAHHVYVARKLAKVFITYNGGPIFNLKVTPDAASVGELQASPSTTTAPESPGEAMLRRGSAKVARRDWTGALADLDAALRAEPGTPDSHYQRALAEVGAKQTAKALADLDAVLAARPKDKLALLERARLRSDGGDEVGARADIAAFDAQLTAGDYERLFVAEILTESGEPDRAIAIYDTWLDHHQLSAIRWSALSGRCLARAVRGSPLLETLPDCDAALRLEAASSDIHADRGYAEFRAGDWRGAANDFEAALRLDPKNAWALYGRGTLRLRDGYVKEGAADIAAAEAEYPAIAAKAARLKLAIP